MSQLKMLKFKKDRKITLVISKKCFGSFRNFLTFFSKRDFDVGLVTHRMKSAKRHRKEPTVHRSFSELPNSGRN